MKENSRKWKKIQEIERNFLQLKKIFILIKFSFKFSSFFSLLKIPFFPWIINTANYLELAPTPYTISTYTHNSLLPMIVVSQCHTMLMENVVSGYKIISAIIPNDQY